MTAGSSLADNHEADGTKGMAHSDMAKEDAMGEMRGDGDTMMQARPARSSGRLVADFLLMKIPHHQSAIDMARVGLEQGEDEETKAMAQEILDAQEAEIKAMRAMLERMVWSRRRPWLNNVTCHGHWRLVLPVPYSGCVFWEERMTDLIGPCLAVLALLATAAQAQEPADLSELSQGTHIHGLAFDPQNEDRILIATHHGLFTFDLAAEELAPLGESRQDFMGFSVAPSGIFYGSGHPETGGNSGVITSSDGGVSWTPLSEGAGGPVDFHQLTVSSADPATLYGAYAGRLQRSQDAGATWEVVGPAPDKLIDLAASSDNPEILYAATETGLLRSTDGGASWAAAHPASSPVSFVETTSEDAVHAFILGVGLVRADEDGLEWAVVSEPLGAEYILHFALNGMRAVAATGSGAILFSETGGQSWRVLGR